jgi:RimJ/RimL family protein N-acetyltransferase
MNRIVITQHKNVALVVLEKSDLDIIASSINNSDITKFYFSSEGMGSVYSRSVEEKRLDEKLSKPWHSMGIYLIKEELLVWEIDLNKINVFNRNGSLGITLYATENIGKWIGMQSIRLMLRYAFEMQGFHKVSLAVRADNLRAISCYEKCGFQEYGHSREHIWTWETYIDSVMMDILASDYRQLKSDWFQDNFL